MEGKTSENTEKKIKQAASIYSFIIDGKEITVRVFFADDGETMQQKTERMLRADIMNAVSNTIF